jgi:putative ABC transport system substrate-binding protein
VRKAAGMKKLLTVIIVVILIAAVVGGYFLFARGTEGEKTYRVGILSGLSFIADAADGFKAGMAESGYVEGKNIVYDLQKTDFDFEEYKRIARKFVTDKVDLIFSFPTEASLIVEEIIKGTSVQQVFTIANIEDNNLVKSVREPGGNTTGVRYPGPDIALKRFEIMRELAPHAKRIWIPYQRGYPIVASQLKVLRPAAEAADITLIEAPADNAAEVQALLDERAKSADTGIDFILSVAEPLFVTPDAFEVMSKFAAEHKIPIAGAYIKVGEYESIFGVHVNNVNVGKQAAPLADKVLRGVPAGTIPVATAESYIQISPRAAQKFGLTVPESLLSAADEIIR